MPPEAAFAGTGSNEEIYNLTIEDETSGCPIPTGGYKITGKQETELPNAEESLNEHEVVAKKSLSDLKIGGNEASLSATDKVKMSSSHGGLLHGMLAWAIEIFRINRYFPHSRANGS